MDIKQLKNIEIDSINVSAELGSHIYNCQREAMHLSLEMECDVRLQHNGRFYQISFKDALSSIKQVFVDLPLTNIKGEDE